MGRRRINPDELTKRRMVYLGDSDWKRLRRIGQGNTSKAIRMLLGRTGVGFSDFEDYAIDTTTKRTTNGRNNYVGRKIRGRVSPEKPPDDGSNGNPVA